MIRTDGVKVDNLQALFGATDMATAPASTGSASGSGADWATLSAAGNKVSQALDETGVREGKVAEVRAALSAGTMMAPASAVASSAVNAMLASNV